MSPLASLGSSCSSCGRRVAADSPTLNPPMDTLTIGRSICVAQMYIYCQSLRTILGVLNGMIICLRSNLCLRIIVVDSTRAGKRIPDALSKTIPIWCAVVNKAIAKKFPSAIPPDWETNLFTPPASVSRQEHYQIEMRIDEWAESLAVNTHFNKTRVAN